MRQQIISNRKYLEKKLNNLADRQVIKGFTIKEEKERSETYFRISIVTSESEIELYGDLLNNMEITIDHYFRDVTDYLVGNYKEVIDCTSR